LAAPAAVTTATEAYLEAEDAVAAWLDECCQRDQNAWEPTSALFANWSAWAEKAGEYVGSQRRFGERLESRSITPLRRHEGRGFTGVRLLSAAWAGNP
jgi:putative DNA primase/helicase